MRQVRVIRGALSEAETQLVAAQRLVDDHICRATEQMRSQLQPRTLSRVYLLSPFRSPNSQHRRTETTTLPPGGSRANLGSSAEQLRQLRQLNSAIRAEIRPKLMQIRSMQKVVVALNTDDWWWFVRLGDGFTLWESWRLAVATQTQLECSRRAAVASRPASGIDPEQGSEGQGSEGSEGRTVRSALQGLWSAVAVGTTSVDPDTAGRNNAATRKEAEQEAEEDWFISIANKIFEDDRRTRRHASTSHYVPLRGWVGLRRLHLEVPSLELPTARRRLIACVVALVDMVALPTTGRIEADCMHALCERADRADNDVT
eukprot:CAMPEP_0181172336 /NCGR_PEP_ID=MMETSP1096-20121128/2397_1 /TAXON_ID=156174 ORGANISM="Chrysochromulina ericina, Strain CCMP281" /NCGR_SAMPLE_ID=MMETSP1096 /ASSEMBLY_ACC=CAM_ASM_000453 /LENGTH=315 /DNA_ID=CAMNT_0023260061 /DNA_START=70 /DNA_END=1018 /DNA_ORIENTATION=+